MNILFVGLSGVPYSRRAIDVRLLSFANLFSELGYKIKILNRYSNVGNDPQCDIAIKENIEVIEIVKPLNIPRLRILLYFISLLIEPIKLFRLNFTEKIDVFHVASGHFIDIIAYKLMAKLFHSKVIYHYVEYRSSFPDQSLYHKLNGKLVNKIAPKLWDGAFCISHFLIEKTLEVNSHVKILKVPPICDFTLFDQIARQTTKSAYLLFCGSAGFLEIIKLIIDSYSNSKIKENVQLKMVLNGNRNAINQIQELCPEMEILQNLDYSELIRYYKNSLGLFIPMRDTIQDTARFPNKICEYTASHGLIITTRFGEIPYYFKDKVSALIADDFSVKEISAALDWLFDHSNEIEGIREQSYLVGKQYFDLASYENELRNFFMQINAN